MAVHEIYSKRKRAAERAGKPDVYQYDVIPDPLRYQVEHVFRELFRGFTDFWVPIENDLAREYGTRSLAHGRAGLDACITFLHKADTDHVLDLVEYALANAERELGGVGREIEEINHRFREHGCGYQYENGQIVRVDSQFIHSEVVRPALSLLHNSGFDGPEQEFLEAHSHYRAGKGRDALVSAQRSLESTARAVCDERGWEYAKNQAKHLVDTLFENGLLEPNLQSHFGGLRGALESGVSTLRGPSGHGQGAAAKPEPPDHVVAYALHLTAAAIVFILESHEALG